MERGRQQHEHDHVYIHADRWSVCDNSHAYNHRHTERHSNFRGSWTLLQWCCHPGFANYLHQWHHGYLELGYQQHEHDHVYIHADRLSVCDNSYTHNHYHAERYSKVRCSWTLL